MKQTRFISVFLFSLLLTVSAQEDWQFHINGGLIAPFNSDQGFSGLGKVQYNIDDQFALFIYSGYLSYGGYYLNYQTGFEIKKIADELDHEIIPLLFGGRYTAANSSPWRPFIELELGVTFYDYEIGDIIPVYNPDTGELVSFNRINERRENKVLASLGAGFGVMHQITQNFGAEIGLRLNSDLDENYSILLGGRGTYTTIYWGFVFYLT